jgi:hypothetical protein
MVSFCFIFAVSSKPFETPRMEENTTFFTKLQLGLDTDQVQHNSEAELQSRALNARESRTPYRTVHQVPSSSFIPIRLLSVISCVEEEDGLYNSSLMGIKM